MDNTQALLTQMARAMETSALFSNVEVLPQGPAIFTYEGRKLEGAIRFELGANLE